MIKGSIQKQDITIVNIYEPSIGAPQYIRQTLMYGCESWTVKKAERQRTDAFEFWCRRRLESPLDCKEMQPVHSEDQPWDFFGGNDAKAEAPEL